MKYTNCWEFMGCGRELGGAKSGELGVCPAPVASDYEGANHGERGGRSCWAVAGTLCGGEVQGTLAKKLWSCGACRFFDFVSAEESLFFEVIPRKNRAGSAVRCDAGSDRPSGDGV